MRFNEQPRAIIGGYACHPTKRPRLASFDVDLHDRNTLRNDIVETHSLRGILLAAFSVNKDISDLDLARSNIAARAKALLGKPRPWRPALPGDEIVAAIRAIVAEMPSYGYRRVWALLRRAAQV